MAKDAPLYRKRATLVPLVFSKASCVEPFVSREMVAAGETMFFELMQAGSGSAYLVKQVYLAMCAAKPRQEPL